ncbi:LSm family protein [Marinobacterium lutimaris]|uniref:Uncharacterized protein n=1 Tax=Marinobacterium lutimaris TaxID=568106 RepID=A0A1H6D5V2_9GAMM|nr:hypothetical protein [Marinobacterium lutimaris]SEG80700.1 hypothetical protein SAMN05444390_10566 [Marinobacterium lutimaris]
MRKLATWLFLLVLLLALALGGMYGFYWYQVKTFVDDLAVQVSGQAQIEYDAIYADPRGEVGVDGINITLTQDGIRIPVQSIRVRSDDPFFFFNPQGRIESGDWPGRLSLVVKQAEVGLDSGLVKSIEQQAALAMEANPLAVSPEALACGDLQQLGVAEMRQMGYSRFVSDMVVGLDVDRYNRRVTLNTDFSANQFGSSTVELEFSVASDDLVPAQLLAANPRLRKLEVSYQDGGYNQRRNSFCAEQAGVEVDAYLADHRQLMERTLLASGVDLPELLWDIYSGVNQPGGSLMLTMRPPGGLGPEVMAALGSPGDMIERLNLAVRLNGEPVAVNSIDWSRIQVEPVPMPAQGDESLAGEEAISMDEAVEAVLAEGAEAEVAEAEISDAVEAETAAAPEAEQVVMVPDIFAGMPKRALKPEPKRYRPTELSQLAAMQGHPVRVKTDLGNRFEGRIVEVENGNTLLIEQRLDRGIITYPLEFQQIRSAEVYR